MTDPTDYTAAFLEYDAFTVFDRDAALDLVADVERFVSAVEDLLRVR